MRKVNQTFIGPEVYALIRRARMSGLNRQIAVNAVGVAEAFAEAVFWVQKKVAALGTCFLKHSVKH